MEVHYLYGFDGAHRTGKERMMMIRFFLTIVVAATLSAADSVVTAVSANAAIVASKDSLKVYNNPVSSFADYIVLVNGTATAVHLDSAYLRIEEMDTTGSGEFGGLGSRFHLQWKRTLPARDDVWSLNSVAADTYRLTPAASSSSIRPSLDFSAPGESLSVAFVEIGTCLGCSGVPTWYPPYFRGTLELFFNIGQTVIIRLYSDDVRKIVHPGEPCTNYTCDSVNVRKILDRNGMESVPVSEVSTNANGRITALQLRYSEIPMGAITLPKQVTVIPDEIGNLTALTSIMAGGNAIGSISNRIGRCSNLRSIFATNNGITELPDSMVKCPVLQHLSLENNRLTRLPDSLGSMKALRELNVTRNLLTSLPLSMAELDSIRCVFIAGNRICTLPDVVAARLSDVRAKMYCAAFEPVWPDSQDCSVALAGRVDTRNVPAPAIIRVSQEGSLLTIETGVPIGSADAVRLSDVAGRLVMQVAVSGTTVRLSTHNLARGVYYAALVADGRIVSGRPVLIDR